MKNLDLFWFLVDFYYILVFLFRSLEKGKDVFKVL